MPDMTLREAAQAVYDFYTLGTDGSRRELEANENELAALSDALREPDPDVVATRE